MAAQGGVAVAVEEDEGAVAEAGEVVNSAGGIPFGELNDSGNKRPR